jgi:hypothetical protein
MLRVAADENLHMMFYRDIVAAALQVDPSAAVQAITEEVIGFDMPGVGIQGFTRKALQMAQAGIYDLRIHHTRSSGRCCATGTYSTSRACGRRPSRRGSGWRPTWPRPTGWPAGSRPNEWEPPMPKSTRHDLLARESGCSNSCWARVRAAGSGLEERVGGRYWWTRTLLGSRSVLAGRDGWLCWHRGQIRRWHHGW